MNEGQVLRSLFLSSDKWVSRRIQTLDHTVPGRVKVIESLDLTVPEKAKILGSKEHIVIPIAVFPKGVLRSWWVEDQVGKPLSLIDQKKSDKLVEGMLDSALAIAGIPMPAAKKDKDAIFSFIQNSDNTSVKSATKLNEIIAAVPGNEENTRIGFVKDLISILASSWIVLVEMPADCVGQRTIIKYGYDLQPEVKSLRLRKDNDSYSIPINDPGFSNDFHIEIHVAPELEIYELSLRSKNEKKTFDRERVNLHRPNCVAHLQNDVFIPRLGSSSVEFQVRPTLNGLRKFTNLTLPAVCLLVVFAWLIIMFDSSWFLQENWRKNSTAGVVLALPAMLLSWIARVPEPDVVARAFYRLRIVNVVLAVGIFSMAAALSTLWQPWVWYLAWSVSLACCIISVLLRWQEAVLRKIKEPSSKERRV